MSSSTLQAQFDAAAEKARSIEGVSNDNKGKLYGYFKQATEGPVGDRPRPGFFDQVGRVKHDAWSKLGDLGKDDAMQQYIALVESL
jgi:acyl-CoA-binding protein